MLGSTRRKGVAIASAAVVVFAVAFAISAGETPAALTLLGAVVVAVMAAWTAEHRLGRQLTAAAERHERELEHDRRERAADRSHERDLAALGDLRTTLAEAAGMVKTAQLSVVTFSADPLNAAQALEVAERVRELNDTRIRLSLRLGRDHPVPSLVGELSGILSAALLAVVARRTDDERSAEIKRQVARYTSVMRAFEEQAIAATDSIAARLGEARLELDARAGGRPESLHAVA